MMISTLTKELPACAQCRRSFVPSRGSGIRRFCSSACWYASPGKRVLSEKICPQCGVSFQPRHYHAKFCGKDCRIEASATARREIACEFCKKTFSTNEQVRFCSRACGRHGRMQQGTQAVPNGTRRKCTNGYVMVKAGPSWRLEHRVVMERVLGRPLLSTENVHHIDGNRANNTSENLELWQKAQPKGIRVSDYHCAGCRCGSVSEAIR